MSVHVRVPCHGVGQSQLQAVARGGALPRRGAPRPAPASGLNSNRACLSEEQLHRCRACSSPRENDNKKMLLRSLQDAPHRPAVGLTLPTHLLRRVAHHRRRHDAAEVFCPADFPTGSLGHRRRLAFPKTDFSFPGAHQPTARQHAVQASAKSRALPPGRRISALRHSHVGFRGRWTLDNLRAIPAFCSTVRGRHVRYPSGSRHTCRKKPDILSLSPPADKPIDVLFVEERE